MTDFLKEDFFEEIFLNEEEIDKIVKRLGREITNDYKDKNLLLISVLKGSVLFISDLMKEIKLYNCEVDFMCMSSYTGTKNLGGEVNLVKDLNRDVTDYDILIVEDILESGYTLRKVVDLIKNKNPKSLKICTLLDKPIRRKTPIEADYVGITIPDKFVVGYGMDYYEKCRNLHFVGILNKKYI